MINWDQIAYLEISNDYLLFPVLELILDVHREIVVDMYWGLLVSWALLFFFEEPMLAVLFLEPVRDEVWLKESDEIEEDELVEDIQYAFGEAQLTTLTTAKLIPF